MRDLQKVYRRYSSNGWRAASLFGIPVPASKYDQFWALDDVSVSIARGERVALVGRNGAGKSTLLRHITGELSPTKGSIQVNGRVKALFGLGDGFHPEFSGLENIRTALALQNFSWRNIPKAIDEIIDFTELEDFINRPLKEYSAGMYARLAFATATAAKPDILIIDEILGAGDAYFLGKCLQRIRDITSDGATVLFVSHDMGSALMLCERGLWIHQGKLRDDADMTTIARRYQAHIREEQELSLRARSMKLSKKELSSKQDTILLRLIGDNETAPRTPLYVSRLAFGQETLQFAETELGKQDRDGDIRPIIDTRTTNWGKAEYREGRLSRPFGNFGGTYTHAPIVIQQAKGLGSDAWAELDVLASRSEPVHVQIFDQKSDSYRLLGTIAAEECSSWKTVRFALGETPIQSARRGEAASDAADLSAEGEGGGLLPSAGPAMIESPLEAGRPASAAATASGTARILDFGFADTAGTRRYTLVSGEPASAEFLIEAKGLPSAPIAVVAIYRPDGTVISQMISPQASPTSDLITGRYTITMQLKELLIGPGDFVVSAALFRYLDPTRSPEDGAYDLRDREYALKIVDTDYQPYPTGLVRQKPTWSFALQPAH